MTRLLFLADTQLGVGTVTLTDQRAVLDRIVQVALDEHVDVVVHGGDVFEGPVVTPEQLRVFLDATEPLRAAGIPLLVLRGNGRHDMAVRPVHALDVLRDVPGFVVADRPDVYVVEGCAICALPWVHPGRLLANLNGSVNHDTVNSVVARMLADIAADLYGKVSLDVPHVSAILVAHWAISSAKLPSGLSVADLREPVLPWADLDAIGYDLIVGAHIHEPQNLNNPSLDETVGFVIGSPQQLNFGEQGERGCWIVTVADGATASKFVPITSRAFVTLDLEVDDLADDPLIPEGAIVRVRTRLTEEEFQALDQLWLRQRFLDAGAEHVRLDLDVERETRRRIEITEQLSPVEAMTLYCDAAGIDEPLRGALILTIKLWSEE